MLREAFKKKKREIVWFFTKGGVPPQSLVHFPVFSSEKTGNPLEVWFSTAVGYPPTLDQNGAGIKEKNSCMKAAFSYAGTIFRSAGCIS